MPTDNNVIRLPIPEHLDPHNPTRSLTTNVRGYFYTLYNSSTPTFRNMLASVGNKDAITKNRMFDRHVAVGLIKAAAKQAEDGIVLTASDGAIYQAIVNVMRSHPDLGLKLRRRKYRELTHQRAAE